MFVFHRHDLARDGRSHWLMEPLNDHKCLLLSNDRGFPTKKYLSSPSCNLRCGSQFRALQCAASIRQSHRDECFPFPWLKKKWKRKLVDVNSSFLCRRLYLVAVQYFRHTSVWDTQLAWNLTWSNTLRGELNDLKSNVWWKRPAVNEDAAELIDAPLAGRHVPWNGQWTFFE